MPWPTRMPEESRTLPQSPADRTGSEPDLTVRVLESIDEVEASAWNKLASGCGPFLQHQFIAALEASGSACADTGWQPFHLVVQRGGTVCAALPLYLKSHSWGEFVFDHAWAEAFHRAGRSYYPKLVSCIPFTPVTGTRLLVAENLDTGRLQRLLADTAADLCRQLGASSLHVLFPPENQLPALEASGLMIRKDCQYHWHNRGYRDFDHFLAGFRSARRKKLRRERRRVREAGVDFRVVTGKELDDELLDEIFRMHAVTFMRRGQAPYLNLQCFRQLRDNLGDSMLVVMAEKSSEPIACAVSFRDDTALYGRYWGAVDDYHSLHFETCFYQGIEYCIREGLQRFEPGAQGEHKLRRGFDPTVTWSAHWIADRAFAAAIGDYLQREAEWLDRYVIDARDQLPFHRRERRDDPGATS